MLSRNCFAIVFLFVSSLALAARADEISLSSDASGHVLSQIRASGGAILVNSVIKTADGNLEGAWIMDVLTYTPRGTAQDGSATYDFISVTCGKPYWVPATVVYPILWFNQQTGQWVSAGSFDAEHATIAMNNLQAQYGNIFQWGQAYVEMRYPNASVQAGYVAPGSSGGSDGGGGPGLLGIPLGGN